MLVYWILLGVTYIIYLIIHRNSFNKTKRKNKRFLTLSAIPAVFVMGLRDTSVGIDTTAYVRNFLIICNLKWSDFGVKNYSHGNAGHYELGYYYLNKIISVFTENPQVILFICAIIVVGCAYYAIYLLSDDVLLSVSLFQTFGFFGYAIALNRQFIAISILLISYFYFIEKKYKRAIIYVCVASLFHTIAIIFLPFYFLLVKSHILKKFKFLVTIGTCMIIPIIYRIIITIIPRYQFYLTYEAKEVLSSGVFAIFLSTLVLAPFFLKKNRNEIYNNIEISYLIQILIIGIMFNLLSGTIFMLGRVVYMFTIFIIIYIPKLLQQIITNKKNRWNIYMIVFLAQCIYYFTYLYYSTGHVCPYIFIWEQ